MGDALDDCPKESCVLQDINLSNQNITKQSDNNSHRELMATASVIEYKGLRKFSEVRYQAHIKSTEMFISPFKGHKMKSIVSVGVIHTNHFDLSN